jgi:hypothetical protein
VLAEVVGPCCHLRPRCRHAACVALGNAHKFRLLSWPKGGLLDVVFVAQFQNFVLAVCDVFGAGALLLLTQAVYITCNRAASSRPSFETTLASRT